MKSFCFAASYVIETEHSPHSMVSFAWIASVSYTHLTLPTILLV